MAIVGAVATQAIRIPVLTDFDLGYRQEVATMQNLISQVTGLTPVIPISMDFIGIPGLGFLDDLLVKLYALNSFPPIAIGVKTLGLGALNFLNETLKNIGVTGVASFQAIGLAINIIANPAAINPLALSWDRQLKLISRVVGRTTDLGEALNALAAPGSLVREFRLLGAQLGSIITTARTQMVELTGVANNLISQAAGVGGVTMANLFDVQAGAEQFLEFEKAIIPFQGLTTAAGETEEAIASTIEEVKRMGIVTSKAPAEVAMLATSLSRLGFSSAEVEESLEGIIRTSEATGIQLAQVGDIVASTLNQFQLGTEETMRVSDVLAAVSSSAATNIIDLGEGLKYAGTTANAAGQPLEDTVATLGLLANTGLAASQTGTGLQRVLLSLQRAGAAAKNSIQISPEVDTEALEKLPEILRSGASEGKALEALGLGKDDVLDASGNLKPLLDILPKLKERVTELQKTESGASSVPLIFNSLFGQEGGRTIQALLTQTEDQINSVRDAANFSEGFATTAAERNLDSLSGSLTLLAGSMQTAALFVGETFAPALKILVDSTLQVVNAFLGLPAPLKTFILLSSAIVPLLLSTYRSFRILVTIKSAYVSITTLVVKAKTAEGRATIYNDTVLKINNVTQLVSNKIKTASGIVTGVLTGKITVNTAITYLNAISKKVLAAAYSLLNKTIDTSVNTHNKAISAMRTTLVAGVALYVIFKQLVSIWDSSVAIFSSMTGELEGMNINWGLLVTVLGAATAAIIAWKTGMLSTISTGIGGFLKGTNGKLILLALATYAVAEAFKSFAAGLDEVAEIRTIGNEIDAINQKLGESQEVMSNLTTESKGFFDSFISGFENQGFIGGSINSINLLASATRTATDANNDFGTTTKGINSLLGGFGQRINENIATFESYGRAGAMVANVAKFMTGQTGLLTREQIANQRTMLATTDELAKTNTTYDWGIDLLYKYGLASFEAADKQRLGAEGIAEFNAAADEQIKGLQGNIDALKQREGRTKAEQDAINTQIKLLERQRDIIKTRVQQLHLDTEATGDNSDAQKELLVSLEDITANYEKNTKAIEDRQTALRLALKEQLASGEIDQESVDEKLQDAELKGIQERIALAKKEIPKLEAAKIGALPEDLEKINQKIVEYEAQSLKDREKALDIQIEKRKAKEKEAAEAVVNANVEAEKAIEASQKTRGLELRKQLAEGKITQEDYQKQELALASEITKEKIEQKQKEIADVQAAIESGQISEVEGKKLIEDANNKLSELNLARIDREIAAQEKLKEDAIQAIEDQISARKNQAEIESSLLDIATQALSNQEALAKARFSLLSAQLGLEENRLDYATDLAEKAGDINAIEALNEASMANQAKQSQAAVAQKRLEFEISKQQLDIEYQQAKIASEVAVLEAQTAIEKAKLSGASANELTALQKILGLREKQAGFVDDNFAQQQEILSIQGQQLSVEEQISKQQLVQQQQNAKSELINKKIAAIEDEISKTQENISEIQSEREKIEESINTKLDRRLSVVQNLGELQSEFSQLESDRLTSQNDLLSAQENAVKGQLSLQAQRLDFELKTAEAAEDEVAVEEIKKRQLILQRKEMEIGLAVKQQQLVISQQQQALELERERIASQLAITEAEISLNKAIASGADEQEIKNLERILGLRLDQANAIDRQAENMKAVQNLERQSLKLESQMAQEAQNFAETKTFKPADLDAVASANVNFDAMSPSQGVNPLIASALADMQSPLDISQEQQQAKNLRNQEQQLLDERERFENQKKSLENQQENLIQGALNNQLNSLGIQVSPKIPDQQRPNLPDMARPSQAPTQIQNVFNNQFVNDDEKRLTNAVQDKILAEMSDSIKQQMNN